MNNQNFKNGCIYYFSERIFTLLNHLNLVEGFKYISQIVTKGNSPKKKILFSRLAVDVFIILKWLLVIILWIFNVEDLWVIFIVWYLLIANLYTYFYYHTWSSNILTDANIDVNRIKRRYLNLTMAIAYTFFGFAYLYCIPYSSEFSWIDGSPNFFHAVWYSISNSLTANYDQVVPSTSMGNSISIIQLIIMFLFLTIIVGNSIPHINIIKKEK